jgi:hypothetical protein
MHTSCSWSVNDSHLRNLSNAPFCTTVRRFQN